MADALSIERPVDRSQHAILVVNDDPVSRYTVVRLLQSAGFETREAATGNEALQAVSDAVSAMVLDIHLPDIDGFEVCRQLRADPQTAGMPVLHLTASYLRIEDKVRGLDSGADAYLTHPVEPSVLIATVQALVRTRLAERAMRLSEAKFRTIFARANSGICRLDLLGRFIDVNPAMQRYLGRDLGELVGRPVSAFVPPDWKQRVDRFTGGALQASESRESFPIVDVNGQEIEYEWHLSTSLEPGVSMAVVTDISERVALERQRAQVLEREREARNAAERLSRMKDEFIAVLSHELRTPLNAILGWAYVLQKRQPGPEVLRGLQSIERNGKMQARLISDLMDMSRLNLGKMQLEFEALDPREVVSLAISSAAPMLQESGIRIEHEASSTRRVVADAARLEQVIWNLLSNAIKFSPRDSVIRVHTRDTDEGVAIAVSDQGKGIDPSFLPHLFDRFTQADAASNRFQGGLGLGLSIVQHLVQAHGGQVSAQSPGLGHGTSFEVRLPVDGALALEASRQRIDPASAPPTGGHAPKLEGLRVLVVDDEPDACEMLQIILSDRGAQVHVARDYESALAQVREFDPDIVVSDVGMPGKDGYLLAAELRRNEPPGRHLPMIALTSYTREQDRRQALSEGFDAHCPKPLRPLQLIQDIERLTRGIDSDSEPYRAPPLFDHGGARRGG